MTKRYIDPIDEAREEWLLASAIAEETMRVLDERKRKGFKDVLPADPPLMTPVMRRLIATGSSDELDDARCITYQHTVLAQLALPYRSQQERIWKRANGAVRLAVTAGAAYDQKLDDWVDVPLRAHRGPRRERRGERPQLGTNERGRAGLGRLQPGGFSPAQGNPRPAVPGAAGKPWARNGPCEAGTRQAPGSKESTGFLSLSESAGNVSEWTEFVLTHRTRRAPAARQHRCKHPYWRADRSGTPP